MDSHSYIVSLLQRLKIVCDTCGGGVPVAHVGGIDPSGFDTYNLSLRDGYLDSCALKTVLLFKYLLFSRILKLR